MNLRRRSLNCYARRIALRPKNTEVFLVDPLSEQETMKTRFWCGRAGKQKAGTGGALAVARLMSQMATDVNDDDYSSTLHYVHNNHFNMYIKGSSQPNPPWQRPTFCPCIPTPPTNWCVGRVRTHADMYARAPDRNLLNAGRSSERWYETARLIPPDRPAPHVTDDGAHLSSETMPVQPGRRRRRPLRPGSPPGDWQAGAVCCASQS